jgi:hypothetical protein
MVPPFFRFGFHNSKARRLQKWRAIPMPDKFHEAYGKLTDFVVKHPEIEIGDSVTSIPESVRPDFYGFFNEARNAFVREKFPTHLAKAQTLKDNYDRVLEDDCGWLSLEEPPTVNPLLRFLRDPKDCLARELFDPLFDLLKGRKNIDEMGEIASPRIEELFAYVFRGGYEKWAVLSLLNLLEVDSAFRINVRNLNPGERTKPAAQAPMEEVPNPQESTRFLFSQPRNAIFAVPDFIAHSSKLNRFIGIRSEFREASYNAINASPDREWSGVDRDLLMLLAKGLTLIYVSEKAGEIALVADVAKFSRPDLVLWCVDSQNINQREAMTVMEGVDIRLKPSKGSYLVKNSEWIESAKPNETDSQARAGEEASGIHVLTVGYDEHKLLPVVEALMDAKSRAVTT